MATVTTGYTFVNNETVTPTKLNSLAGSATVSAIVNADIDAAAGIVDTKLATISTAGKVSNSATTATNANTANAIVVRDASGNFSAGIVSAELSGNASTATTIQTARTIAVSGDVTGTPTSFNGSGNIVIPVTINTGVVNDVNVSNSANISDAKLATISTSGKVANSATTATSANMANAIITRDGSGNFSAGTITANVIGNVTGNLTGSASTVADYAISPIKLSQPLTLATAKATTSGTVCDFTSIPAWAKRITVIFNGISTSGTSQIQLQLGSSSGFLTSGYSGSAGYNNGSAVSCDQKTSGLFIINTIANKDRLHFGTIMLNLLSANIWVGVCSTYSNEGVCGGGGGAVTLPGSLDRVRLTTVNGTDTFDAGSINLMYEG